MNAVISVTHLLLLKTGSDLHLPVSISLQRGNGTVLPQVLLHEI